MRKQKSTLVFTRGYIKSYWNYEGQEEINIFSLDKEYIKNIIPLFDNYMIHFNNRKLSQKQALEYMSLSDEERKLKYKF